MFNSKMKKILIIIFIFAFTMLFYALYNKNDGMTQTKGASVYYRTYTKEQGWSKWTKNGLTSGNIKKKYAIKNIQIKVKSNSEKEFTYDLYNTNEKWISELDENAKIENKKINAIRIENLGKLGRKYDICYRTYNKKNGWLEWSRNGEINGNRTENISGIQIKIIPGNVIFREYLKDYDNNENKSEIGFEQE